MKEIGEDMGEEAERKVEGEKSAAVNYGE